jgi:hypothetical protein
MIKKWSQENMKDCDKLKSYKSRKLPMIYVHILLTMLGTLILSPLNKNCNVQTKLYNPPLLISRFTCHNFRQSECFEAAKVLSS